MFLIPAGMLALLWPGANLSLGRRWRQALVYGIPPVLVYVALTAMNRLLAGPAGAVTTVAAANPWDFAHLASLYPWQALFAIPLGIEPMVLRVWRAVEPAMASWPLLALFKVVSSRCCCWAVWSGPGGGHGRTGRRTAAWLTSGG